MLGIQDRYTALAYVLCILSALLCVLYGIACWNKGRDAAEEGAVRQHREEKERKEKL